MATITVRNLDGDVQQRIRERAAAHHRSMEAEARAILTDAVSTDDLASAWLDLARSHGGVELELPSRSVARDPIEL